MEQEIEWTRKVGSEEKGLLHFDLQEELDFSGRRILKGQGGWTGGRGRKIVRCPLGMLVARPGRWLKEDTLMKPLLQILSGPGDWLDGRDESQLRPRF